MHIRVHMWVLGEDRMLKCWWMREDIFALKLSRSSYLAKSYLFVSIYVSERLHRIYSSSLQNSQDKTWADTKKQPPAIIQSFGPKLSHVE